MKYYYAHGLGILSELNFPEFIIAKTNVDLIIKFGEIDSILGDFTDYNLSELAKARVDSNKTYLIWNDVLICCINHKKIIINSKTNLEEDFLRLLILSYAFAIFLHKRGKLVLHANAINMFGNAVVFLGGSGEGKSTTSLIFNKKGYNLLSDDVLSIGLNNDFPIVYSGFPRIKILPDVIKNLNEDIKLIPKISNNSKKLSYQVRDNFHDSYLPLMSIYLIERSHETKIENLGLQEGLMELIKSSYCYKMFNSFELNENLKQCTEILNKVQLKRLCIKNSIDDLEMVVKIIEKDILEIIQ
jgi:hypothetical protein